jgi:hypothetical protein
MIALNGPGVCASRIRQLFSPAAECRSSDSCSISREALNSQQPTGQHHITSPIRESSLRRSENNSTPPFWGRIHAINDCMKDLRTCLNLKCRKITTLSIAAKKHHTEKNAT